MTLKTFRKNFDDEKFNDDDVSFFDVIKFSIIVDSISKTTFANSQTFNSNNDVDKNYFDISKFSNFLLRIKKIYAKNKRIQKIINVKRKNNKKKIRKLIKKNIKLKFNDCEIKFDFFLNQKTFTHVSKKIVAN